MTKLNQFDQKKSSKLGFTRRSLFLLVALIFGMETGKFVSAQILPLPPNLINLNSPKGEQLLRDSQVREDYLPLSVHFTIQQNKAYCGVASSVMVLNALSISAPKAPEYGTFRFFTQDNFFNAQTDSILTPAVVSRQGITLDEFGKLLKIHAAKVKVYHSDETNLETFRTLAISNLSESGDFILVNYLRTAIQQKMGGHFSPLAAYHKQTDRFLILDVARYMYPPVWVTAEELWDAMVTIDPVSGKKRGFVMVSVPLKME